MKLPRIRNGSFAIALALVSIAAFAESPNGPSTAAAHTRQWTTADKNQDGQLSREELIPFPAFAKDFDAMDRNADGKISREEYAVWRNAQKGG